MRVAIEEFFDHGGRTGVGNYALKIAEGLKKSPGIQVIEYRPKKRSGTIAGKNGFAAELAR